MNKEDTEMSGDIPSEDKRIFDRRNFNSLLKFKSQKRDISGEGMTRNVSASGAAFIVKERLNPKDRLELWIDVTDGQDPIYKNAEVVWSKENLVDTHETGVRFDSVGLLELSRIFKQLGR